MSYATKTESSAQEDEPKFYKERRFRIAVRLLGILYRVVVLNCDNKDLNKKIKDLDQKILLGDLLNIRLAPWWMRWFRRKLCHFADLEKWKQVEAHTFELMKLLDGEERRKVQIKFISNILLE